MGRCHTTWRSTCTGRSTGRAEANPTTITAHATGNHHNRGRTRNDGTVSVNCTVVTAARLRHRVTARTAHAMRHKTDRRHHTPASLTACCHQNVTASRNGKIP